MQRLKTRSQFSAVLTAPPSARTPHFALHRCAVNALGVPTPAQVCLGALVPKRWARRAVTRNAIKRQIFSQAEACAPSLPPLAHVVRLRAGFDSSAFPSASSVALRTAVRQELQQLFAYAAQGAPTQACAL